MRESTDHQLPELRKTKGKEVPELVYAPQPDAAKENTKQIDRVIPATGLQRIILTKAMGDAWESMQEEHYRNILQRVFVGKFKLLLLPTLLRPALTWIYSCGMALPVDGSADDGLFVEGLGAEE